MIIDKTAYLWSEGFIDALLIVAPNGVHENWIINEIPTHMPEWVSYRAASWYSAMKKDELAAVNEVLDPEFAGLRIIAMNIEAFQIKQGKGTKFAEHFLNSTNCHMVVDESSRIKSPGAARTKNIARLGRLAECRAILTGTPITQGPLDLYSQFGFLSPDILGHKSFFTYKNHYAVWERKLNRKTGREYPSLKGYRNIDELKQKIAPHSFRVLKAECLDLPEKIYERRYVSLSDEQRKLYNQIRKQVVTELDSGHTLTVQEAMVRMLRLQQVIGGFVPVDDGRPQRIPGDNPRIESMLELIEETSGSIIIWARFVAELQMIRDILIDNYGPGSVACWWGEIRQEDRQSGLLRFQEGTSRFFIGQPHSAGYGLTLHAASNVIYYSNDFSLEARLQSEDRAHRIGQRNNVLYTDMEARGTVDSRIVAALRSKKSIADAITGDKLRDWI
jgi:SNF2 family DNA or RNA helicase